MVKNNLSTFLFLALSALCCRQALGDDSNSVAKPERNVIQGNRSREMNMSVPEELLDAGVPATEKAMILLRYDCSVADVWGPVLSKILASTDEKTLQATALVKLRSLTKWDAAQSVLVDFGLEKKHSLHTRMIAVEGMANHPGSSVTEALVAIANDKKEPQNLRIVALSSLQRADAQVYAKTEKDLSANEPGLVSAFQAKKAAKVARRVAAFISPDKEQTACKALATSKGEKEVFQLIQTLANGSQEETIQALISRYASETETNKAEIAVAVTKIARRNAKALPEIRDFLTASAKNETSDQLRSVIQQCLPYLDQE